jgi:hypothetical protein
VDGASLDPDRVRDEISPRGDPQGLAGGDVKPRQVFRALVDEKGILATPANSSINELVLEAGRRSILNDGLPVAIGSEQLPAVEARR